MSDQYRDDNVTDLRKFLGETSLQYQQLMTISMGLKRRQIMGGQATAKATVEILRVVLGSGKYYNAAELMRAARAVGKELSSSAPGEVTIGNVIRRVLYLIREEFAAKLMNASENGVDEGIVEDGGVKKRRDSSSRSGSLDLELPAQAAATAASAAAAEVSNAEENSTPRGTKTEEGLMAKRSLGNVLGAFGFTAGDGDDFQTPMPTLRQTIMGGINELNDEIDNVLGPICEQSMEQIHADACVLVYGWSQVVESFLRAAARKRKFQIIIVEAGPDLSGHKLAEALKDAPNVSCTLIADCAVYAVMGRVNTVLVAPDAVTADGGAICKAGHLIVATTAKEHHVPVVGLASTFLLTPQFAHSSHEGLGQLLSPSMIVQYNANVCQENVEVVNPAYDFLPPAVMDLHVTNNGSHQPSYIYRLLSEFYCPADHIL